MKYNFIVIIFGFFFSLPLQALGLSVEKAIIKSPITGQKITVGFMEMKSDQKLMIKKIYASKIDKIEIHTMQMKNGIMRMRKIVDPRVSPKSPLNLKPGGDHLMLFGIKKTLDSGDNIDLFFDFGLTNNKNITKKIRFNIR
jgi:copper(I)-binding protein